MPSPSLRCHPQLKKVRLAVILPSGLDVKHKQPNFKIQFVEFVVDAQPKTGQIYLTLFSELLCSWRFSFLKNAGMVGHF